MIGPGAKPNRNHTAINKNRKEVDTLMDVENRETNFLGNFEGKETEISSSTFGKGTIQQKGKNLLKRY